MFTRFIVGIMAGTALMMAAEAANAGCGGPAASPQALSDFEKDPVAYLANRGNGPISADIQALAVAASNSPDLTAAADAHYANFQNALKTALGTDGLGKPNNKAASEQSKAVGTALGALAATCAKNGPEETAFVTAVQNGVAQSGNQVADSSYGRSLNEPQTAATEAGGGTGVGGQTGIGGAGNGGGNNGPLNPNIANPTATRAEDFSIGTAGTAGTTSGTTTGTTTTTATGTTGTSGTNGTGTGTTTFITTNTTTTIVETVVTDH